MFSAAEKGDSKTIEQIVPLMTKISGLLTLNYKNNQGLSLLQVANNNHHSDTVKLLFKLGAIPTEAIREVENYRIIREKIKREYFFWFLSPLRCGRSRTEKLAAADTLIDVLKGKKPVEDLKKYRESYGEGELLNVYKKVQTMYPNLLPNHEKLNQHCSLDAAQA